MIESNGYYVDKTELIYELVEETGNKVTLFTRPRRFGKCLTMSMLESFFDIRRTGSKVFEGLNIVQNHPEFCERWMHQYPTLMISLKDVEGLDFDGAYAMLQGLISGICIRYDYLETDSRVSRADAEIFHKLLFITECQSEDEKKKRLEEIKNSLKMIMRLLHAVYGKPVVLLIDEYDVPLAKASENHYSREMLDVIRGIMSTSLKSNEYLKSGVVTGCLRFPKKSIFTGVNNFRAYSVLDDECSSYFGFTENEIKNLLKYYGREESMALVRAWYDGYVFGNTEIYCPWDVMCYVSVLRKRRNAKPESYWANTSGNGVIKAFFILENEDVSDQFETLLNGGTIVADVTNALTYEDAYSSVNHLWSVLLMTGYVTAVNYMDSDSLKEEGPRSVELRIPNREIAGIFQKTAVDHFLGAVDQGRISDLMSALWNGDEVRASEILSDLLFETISYMDYHEDYYHAFIAGIFTGRVYLPQSNKEQGLGRPDVNLKDRRNRSMMVIACKKSESRNRMDYWCDEAIRQIVDEKYTGKTDGFNVVLCYGVSFFEKSAKVKLMR